MTRFALWVTMITWRFASGLLKQGDELIVNGFWIKVFFWLVDNQRSDVIIIECKLE